MTASLAPAPRIDESRDFHPVRIAVLTVSDTRGPEDDKSGDILVARLTDGQLDAMCAFARADRPELLRTLAKSVTGVYQNQHLSRGIFDMSVRHQ